MLSASTALRRQDRDGELIFIRLPAAMRLHEEAAAINALAEKGIAAGEEYAYLYGAYAKKRDGQ